MVVAQDLLGCVVSLDGVALRIATEAYRGDKSACHAHRGQTRRNAPLFGPPGHGIHLCYGIRQMLNFVTGPRASPGCLPAAPPSKRRSSGRGAAVDWT